MKKKPLKYFLFSFQMKSITGNRIISGAKPSLVVAMIQVRDAFGDKSATVVPLLWLEVTKADYELYMKECA